VELGAGVLVRMSRLEVQDLPLTVRGRSRHDSVEGNRWTEDGCLKGAVEVKEVRYAIVFVKGDTVQWRMEDVETLLGWSRYKKRSGIGRKHRPGGLQKGKEGMALRLQIPHVGWRRVYSGARLDMGYAHALLILRSPRIFLRAGLTPDEANLLSFPRPAPLLAVPKHHSTPLHTIAVNAECTSQRIQGAMCSQSRTRSMVELFRLYITRNLVSDGVECLVWQLLG
jgi:hypothetical protein